MNDEKKRTLAATTHFPSPILPNDLSDKEKIHTISYHFAEIMKTLGLDLQDHSLAQTPERVARMYVEEVFKGLSLSHFPKISFFKEDISESDYKGVVVTKANFISFCEHHFVPMVGIAFVGYIPNGQVIGLSKISRLVRYFAARPQLQERLSAQIADSLSLLLDNEDVAVSIQAQHMCVISRGAKDEGGCTTTLYTKGKFQREAEVRRDFQGIINQMLAQENANLSMGAI